jgi:hypothetical protein
MQPEVCMPELQLLQLLIGSLRARLAGAQPREAGALTLELVTIAVILVAIASVVFILLRSKVEQGVTRITLP